MSGCNISSPGMWSSAYITMPLLPTNYSSGLVASRCTVRGRGAICAFPWHNEWQHHVSGCLDLGVPEGGCGTWRRSPQALRHLTAPRMRHYHLGLSKA